MEGSWALDNWRGFGGSGGAGFRLLEIDGDEESPVWDSPETDRKDEGFDGREGGGDFNDVAEKFISASRTSGSVNERWTP